MEQEDSKDNTDWRSFKLKIKNESVHIINDLLLDVYHKIKIDRKLLKRSMKGTVPLHELNMELYDCLKRDMIKLKGMAKTLILHMKLVIPEKSMSDKTLLVDIINEMIKKLKVLDDAASGLFNSISSLTRLRAKAVKYRERYTQIEPQVFGVDQMDEFANGIITEVYNLEIYLIGIYDTLHKNIANSFEMNLLGEVDSQIFYQKFRSYII